MRKLLTLLFGLSLLIGTAVPARAQGQARAELYPADASGFPAISALLDVFNTNGIFASGLKPEAVTVVENGQAIPVTSLNEIAVPLQLVVAVNQGPSLDARDTSALSRFQRVHQVLNGWAQARPADLPDDISLVSQAGQVIEHSSAADFIASLDSFQPNFRAATPNLQSLAIALDTVSQQTPRLGMKRAVLFITPHMDDPNIATALQPLIQTAKERQIRVFVWFVDTATYFTTTSAAAFNSLAMETGGSMFGYSGLEKLPDPEEHFSSLRRVYSLSYQSMLTAGGEYKLNTQVSFASGTIQSEAQTLKVDIQPPNPIFISPPMQITRRAPADDPFDTETLLPEVQPVDIIVEFPDLHKRPLTRTALYVDGQVVDENTSEPFDKFTWDLTAYKTSGEHQLMVEAWDSLGLNKASISLPVTVTVVIPPHGAAALLASYRQEITIGAIAVAGLALVIMLLSGRVRLPSLRARQKARQTYHDPVTQPIRAVETPTTPVLKVKPKRGTTDRATGPRPKVPDAPASFIRLDPDGQPATSNPIIIAEKELTLGVDPVQASHVLDDPSVAPLHARLRQTDDGSYLLFDNNSIAGTWVNFEPVPREGQRLAHGDVVHFGQLAYRFTLRNAPAPVRPRITVPTAEE